MPYYPPGIETPVSVPNGGTGATSFTAGAILIGNGTSAIQVDTGLTFDTTTDELTVGGNLLLPTTTSLLGQIKINGNRMFHAYPGTGTGNNLFIGESAGNFTLTSAYELLAVGKGTLGAVTTGNRTVAIGANAGRDLTTGFSNLFIGGDAGIRNNGNSNVFLGYASGYGATGSTATACIGIGVSTFGASTSNPFGSTAIGHEAGSSITSANYNTLIGFQAGLAGTPVTSGANNTMIGASAQVNSATSSNRTAIGFSAICAADNRVQLGDANVTLVNTQTAYGVAATQVVNARKTGWTVPTGTPSRAGYATSTATLTQVAETLKALIDDLHATAGHGLIGT